jgi:hypothetical protein
LARLRKAGRLLDHPFLPSGRHCGLPLLVLGDSLLSPAPGLLPSTRLGLLLQLHLRRPSLRLSASTLRLFASLGGALPGLLRALRFIVNLAIRATARNNSFLDGQRLPRAQDLSRT